MVTVLDYFLPFFDDWVVTFPCTHIVYIRTVRRDFVENDVVGEKWLYSSMPTAYILISNKIIIVCPLILFAIFSEEKKETNRSITFISGLGESRECLVSILIAATWSSLLCFNWFVVRDQHLLQECFVWSYLLMVFCMKLFIDGVLVWLGSTVLCALI